MAWLNEKTGFYSVGDQQPGQIEVPDRLSPTDHWANSGWIPGPPVILQSVSPRQARLALFQAGLLDQVNATVAAADNATKITWEFATSIDRGSVFVSTMASVLNLTPQQLDTLFISAATF